MAEITGQISSEEMDKIVDNIQNIKTTAKTKPKKESISLTPLKFQESPNDSVLKKEIIKRINERNLLYADLYAYCTKLKGGDFGEGQKFGYNLISGLKNRQGFTDQTLLILVDFLELDIVFMERPNAEPVNPIENEVQDLVE